MLIVKSLTVGTERYGDAYECNVTFQVGPQSYSTVVVKLTPEATREVVELAVTRASAMLTVIPSEIKISGEAVAIEAAPERVAPLEQTAPMSALVDEYPPEQSVPFAAATEEVEPL